MSIEDPDKQNANEPDHDELVVKVLMITKKHSDKSPARILNLIRNELPGISTETLSKCFDDLIKRNTGQ